MENTKKTKRLGSNFFLLILSVLSAVVIWIVLNMTAFPEMSTTIRNVPIDYSMDGTYADVAGLSLIGEVPETVNVKITGLRYDIADYTAKDLKVTPNFDPVRTSGVYELTLDVVSVDGDQIVVDQKQPGTVHVEFDYMVSKTFSVSDGTLVADISNVYAETGFILDSEDITISPDKVTISGPKDYVDSVTSCKVVLNESTGLSESYSTGNTTLKLYSGDAVYESEMVKIENDTVNVKIPVYIKKLLNLDVEMRVPFDKFDVESLVYSVSPSSIIVRSQNPAINNISDIKLGYIELRNIDMTSNVKTFEIGESSYYTNISGIDKATVTFDFSGYSTKKLQIPSSQIYPLNVPEGYRVNLESNKISNIEIIGPADIINRIDASDVIAELDLINQPASAGSNILNATIYLPNYTSCWAIGTYQVPYHLEPIATEAMAPAVEGEPTEEAENEE